MPPKAAKSDKGPSKKTEQKKKEKVVEDKTFGLKNKKGSKQQKFIQHVQKQTMQGNVKASKLMELEKQKMDSKKDAKKKAAEELNLLFKPVEQKLSKGADPKSVLCAFFKAGSCGKGAKCKFSHDLNIERKAEKRNVYEDEGKKDTMDDWDEAQLEEVVNKKHGETNKSLPPTSIICKYFLEAVENNKYGWFWECPNGGIKCHYRHALPQGFVLKRDKKKLEENKEEISLEELIEKERAALSSKNLTKVTLESFTLWKKRKRNEKKKQADDKKKQKKSDFKQGKILGISGREMFEFNPELVNVGDDDEGEDALAAFRLQDEEEEIEEGAYSGPIREINLESLEDDEGEVDATGITQRTEAPRVPPTNGPTNDNEDDKLMEAAAGGDMSASMAATLNGDAAMDTPIDENLFDGDDIDLVDDELDELELDD